MSLPQAEGVCECSHDRQFHSGVRPECHVHGCTCNEFQPAAPVSPTPAESEAVDHPAHYGGAETPYEAIKVIQAWDLGFCLGNAIKYICRAGKKDGSTTIQDLKKARWYLSAEIYLLENKS